MVDARPALVLCSEDSLDLGDHPRVREAAADAALRWGVGVRPAPVHRRLAEALAAWHGVEAVGLAASAPEAAAGVLAALADRRQAGGGRSATLLDAAAHPGLVAAARLADADLRSYDHADPDHLGWLLGRLRGQPATVVTESVFALGGDVAPVAEVVELARRAGARVVVDEAHAVGCLGAGGAGVVADAGLWDEVDVVLGPLGGALASDGAYVACSRAVRALLRGRPGARLPTAPAAAGALAALGLLRAEPERGERLRANAAALRDELAREGFAVDGSGTHLLALLIGDAGTARDLADLALADGVAVEVVGPPTVEEGAARVRLAVTAAHTRSELRDAARVLGRAALRAGFRPGAGLPLAAAPGSPRPTTELERRVAEAA